MFGSAHDSIGCKDGEEDSLLGPKLSDASKQSVFDLQKRGRAHQRIDAVESK